MQSRPDYSRRERLTPDVGLDGVDCVNQRLPLSLSERAVVDKAADLIDEGVEPVAGRARLTLIELGNYSVDLVNQPITLVLRQRACGDQSLDLADEQREVLLWRASDLNARLALQRQVVTNPGRNRCRAADAARRRHQAIIVIAPADNRAVRLHRQDVKAPGGNRYRVARETLRTQSAPHDDRAIRFQRHAETGAERTTIRGNRRHIAQTSGRCRLPTDVT